MLDIVFGDSLKGMLKYARGGSMVTGRIRGFGPAEADTVTAEVPILTDTGEVACIGFALDVGDISDGLLGRGRREAYRLLWGRFHAFHDSGHDTEGNDYFAGLEEDCKRLMFAAEKGEPLRIWLDRSPATVCGLYALCHAIRGLDCPVYVAELPQYLPGQNSLRRYAGWGEMEPEQLPAFAEAAKALHPMLRRHHANAWQELVEQNAPLRAVVNGELMSVPEDFYDHLILRHIPNGEFHMARLIGEVLGRHQIGVGDGWYAARIERMISDGRLKVVSPGSLEHPYSRILARA